MDSPQYLTQQLPKNLIFSFKPYYKWIVLNTKIDDISAKHSKLGFKPYYKWIVLNTSKN